ncbi:MAG: YigZ family protein [Xanthomonadales bacterium]|nr:YigZ family protein [Xanthomonadales bacterium]
MNRVTLARPARLDVDIRKSRFLAQASPVACAEDAMAFLAEVADPSATHNCWAWRIGQNYRFSDDGEPASTAGKPILAAIDGQDLDGVMVVVTRWFGGIKLGAGGLVRAYGGTAAECLRRADRIEIIVQAHGWIHCGFEHLGSVHAQLDHYGARKLTESYTANGVQLEVELPRQHLEAMLTTLGDATRGQARWRSLDEPSPQD